MKIGYSVLLSSRLLDFRVQGGTKHVISVLLTSDCLDPTGIPLLSSPMWTCGTFRPWFSFTEDVQGAPVQLIGYQKRSSISFSCGGAYRHIPIIYIPLLIAALPITSLNNLTSTRQPSSGNRKIGATTTAGYERCQWGTYGERNARYSFYGHLRMTSISGARSKTRR
jgi:hypothetical protein